MVERRLGIQLIVGLLGVAAAGCGDDSGSSKSVSAGVGGAVTGIGGMATGVGGTATGVGGAVTGLGGAVMGVGGTVTGVGGAVTGLGGAVMGVGGAATGVGGAATGLGGAVTGMGGTATGLGGAVTGLGGAVAGLGGAVTGVGGDQDSGGAQGVAGDQGVGGDGTGGDDTGGTGGTITGGSDPWISFDAQSIVARSNIILESPNSNASDFMPLGNGSLGAAAWAANGLSVQLNRIDTMPDRKSIGHVTVPGLQAITSAGDFSGVLDLYNGVLIESGGGMTARIYVRADADQLVVDVTGADPSSNQTASVSLWAGRNPQSAASGAVATLSESWTDGGSWSSNQRFGTLAALTAGGRNVSASANGSTVTVTFQPNDDGSFRVICGSPEFDGSTDASSAASQILANDATAADLESAHNAWWNDFWGRVGLMKMTGDADAEYFENLRAMFLFAHASESRGVRPGSQAGVADLFNFNQDTADWYPAAYWFWNLRMQVAAAATSGAFELNEPLFHLYSSNLSNIQEWTRQRMGGRSGICVPETMRFNGNGWWYDGNHSCDEASAPSYNALTLSTGAEISLWIWQTYLMTEDLDFLSRNFPFMLEAARFLHEYSRIGNDGKLLMQPSNAHENQWSVTNPMGDIAAMLAFYPALVEAAQLVGSNDSLIGDIQSDIPLIPDLPRTNTGRNQVTTPASDSTNIFADSAEPTAQTHNVENDDLEPLWPYDLVSDATPTEFDVAQRTYSSRRNQDHPDWSNDAISAARLGLADEVPARLSAVIERYQVYPAGFAAFDPNSLTQPYIEAMGVLATAINEAVATAFDGTVRLAPALPNNWSVSGSVYVRGRSKVHVHFQNGQLVFGVLEAGSNGTVDIRNPWPAEAVVVDDSGQEVVAPTSGNTLTVNVVAGHAYLIKRSSDPIPSLVEVTGTPATTVKTHGSRVLGVR